MELVERYQEAILDVVKKVTETQKENIIVINI